MGLPKTIKIGDKEYNLKDTPELIELIETARKEEKNKLHGEILSLKSAMADSGATKEELASLKNKLEEAVKAKEDLDKELIGLKALHKQAEDQVEKSKTSGKTPETPTEKKDTVDFEKKLNEAVENVTKTLQEKYDKILNGYETKIETLERSNQSFLVEKTKEKILKDHEGYIIPELISGNTVEELNASLQKALAVSKKYITVKDEKGSVKTLEDIEKAKKEEDNKVAGQNKNTPVDFSSFFQLGEDGKPIIARPPKTETAPEDLVKNLNEMSTEEFKKNKDAIKKQLMTQQKEV